ncbi:MAG: outer membrane protein assembly factor BamB [Rhodocyclaceae bacterium]|nr:outer membrane protein assembly factor BamB [Rhodocyclaceae bacterium]
MRRRGAFLLLLGAAFFAGCGTLGDAVDKLNPFSRAGAKAKPSELPSFSARDEVVVRWRYEIGSAGGYVFSPAVVGKSVFVAARDGTLARVDQGREVWRIKGERILSGGVGSDGKLVVVGTPKGEVLAFSADEGRLLWHTRVSSEVLSAPVIVGDLVIVRSNDHRLFGLEASDGKRRWFYQRATPPLSLRSTAGVAATPKAVYMGFPGGKLVAIALNNGAPLWEATVALPRGATELERIADVVGEPVVFGAEVCAVAFQGRLACFDAESGRPLWSRDVSSLTGLAMTERTIYLADDKDRLLAFERISGGSLWKQERLAGRGLGRPLALGRRIAVADQQGYIHILDPFDGDFTARIATEESGIFAPLVPYGDGFLAQTANGGLFALTVK